MLVCGYCALVTEALSYFSAVNFTSLLVCWAALLVLSLFYFARKIDVKAAWLAFGNTLKVSPLSWIILSCLAVSSVVALVYPPNNYDSMTYHLARVAHWHQNHNISHYATHIVRQLHSPPFAEWILLHLRTLTGGDSLANTVQLFFFAGSIVNVSLITKELGGNAKTQLLGALVTCLVPMAIIQSNTTQNDIVTGFFVTAFAYYTIRIYSKVTMGLIILAGLSLGLSQLTKGTGAIYTVLFCGWFFLMLIKSFRLPVRTLIRNTALFALVPLVAVLINAGHFYRNFFMTGSYLGNASEGIVNESFQGGSLLLVGMKNFFTHTPADKRIKYGLSKVANIMGVDMDDTRYSMMPTKYMLDKFSFHEDYAQNFVHAILIILTLLYFFSRKRIYIQRPNLLLLYACTICATGILYCVAFKWQPWGNRLQTGLFFLFSPFLAIQLAAARKWLRTVAIFAMLGFAIPSLLLSEQHALLPVKNSIYKRSYDSYIYDEGLLKCKTYLDTKPYTKLGLVMGADYWDYPYYKLLSNCANGNRIIKHVFVKNESAIYLDDFVPDAIISHEGRVEKYELRGVTYYRSHIFGNTAVLFERRQ